MINYIDARVQVQVRIMRHFFSYLMTSIDSADTKLIDLYVYLEEYDASMLRII